MKNSNMFRARLYAAMSGASLSELADSEPLVLYAKIIDLLEKFGVERNKLGLYTGSDFSNHYYTDTVVDVQSIH